MHAVYLKDPRPGSLDQVRAVVEALERAAVVVTTGSPPLGWPIPWVDLGSDSPAPWRAWVAENRPELVTVVGSAEHALAARSDGRTVVLLAAPDPDVRTEGLAHRAADVVLAPWPASPGGSAGGGSARGRSTRTIHVGALGWAAGAVTRRAAPPQPSPVWSCVVLSASSAGFGPRERRDLLADSPGWSWWFATEREVLQPHGPIWDRLRRADVVVCAPTQPNLAAVVATGAAAVLLMPERPSSQQVFLAGLAERTGPAVVTSMPRSTHDWRALLQRVRELRGSWDAWDPRPGLDQARLLLGDRGGPMASSSPVPRRDRSTTSV